MGSLGKAVHIAASHRTRTFASAAVAALLLSSLLGSCGVRTAISAESDWDEHDAGPKLLPCGYGPPCNPRDFGGQTCQGLGLQPGNLSCDPKTCFLVLTGCGKTTGTTGTGTPGTPGATQPGTAGAGNTGMDAGALFGGLFGAQAGAPATPGTMTGTPMTDEDGGVPGFFGNGFFGGNFFGAGFFGAGNQMMNQGTPGGAGNDQQPNGVDPEAFQR
jgi:hypothetical protein